jgi:hypothetical protein
VHHEWFIGRSNGRQLNVASLQSMPQANDPVFDQLHVDTGMAMPEGAKEWRECMLYDLRRRSDPKDSRFAYLEHARVLGERIGLGQQTTAAPKQLLTFRRQSDATSDAIKEQQLQFVLQRVNLSGGGRLAEVQSGRRAGDAAGVNNRHERAQMTEVHFLMLFSHYNLDHNCIGFIKKSVLVVLAAGTSDLGGLSWVPETMFGLSLDRHWWLDSPRWQLEAKP